MTDLAPPQQEKPQALNPCPVSIVEHLRHAGLVVVHHAKKHVGVGIVCAVAYFDPGNWGVDLQAGSQFGYRLLFIVLVAGLFAVFLQVLATRLGCVTGIDLASHSRLLLYNRPKHTLLYRWLGLYPLYALAEVAIIATDLAELLGSAIALCMLFPKLQLWQGVLITAFDVVLILGMGDPLRGKPVRMFELLIAGMVVAVLVCMVVIISKVDVSWAHAFEGYIPSKAIFSSGGVYTSVGILGATVMPHSLFIGSALATQDRISFRPRPVEDLEIVDNKDSGELLPATPMGKASMFRQFYSDFKESILSAFRKPPPSIYATSATRHNQRQNNSFEFIKAHIYYGTVDVIGSLLGFAVVINSMILMLASAVFFYGVDLPTSENTGPASLFDAYDLIRDIVGQSAATLFAIALLAAGQSSSIIATVAGQAVCEGFLQWRVSPVVRRLLTRLLAIIPSMAVAVMLGRSGIDTLLVASQVVLSIVLPFITLPLLYCTSSKAIMSVRKTRPDTLAGDLSATAGLDLPSASQQRDPNALESADTDEVIDYSNNKATIIVGAAIWLIIVAANMYVIVELALGQGA